MNNLYGEMMQNPVLPQRIPAKPVVGAKAAFSRTLTEADVALFIGVTWDVNPLHTDDNYVSQTRFKRRIVPGLLTASLLTHLGGLWAFLAQEMRFEFQGPVYIGDTITAESEVVEVDEGRGWVRLHARCINNAGHEVLRAQISGYPGQFAGAV
jgi:3-hydroxybutyryl-CoA dehydratase